eukprot:635548-Pyramimonas_sp.AAC.1
MRPAARIECCTPTAAPLAGPPRGAPIRCDPRPPPYPSRPPWAAAEGGALELGGRRASRTGPSLSLSLSLSLGNRR